MIGKGKRYSKEEKQEVVDFVVEYNSENNGRGGVANACRKFGATAITINAWMNKFNGGVSKTKLTGKARVYLQLSDLQAEVEVREAEIQKINAKIAKLTEQVA